MMYLDAETWKGYFDESARDLASRLEYFAISVKEKPMEDVVRKAYQPLTSLQMVAPPIVKQTPKEMFTTILSAYTTADAGMIWEDMVYAGLIVKEA